MSDVLRITTESFDEEVMSSPVPVVLDFWGPQCIPCIQLDPFVEKLSEEFDGRVKVAKVIAPENRRLCGKLKVMGLPTFLAFNEGVEVERITGDVTQETLRDLVESLADAKVAGEA